MAAEPSAGAGAESAALREYYSNTDYVTTAEGVLKLLAILGCLAAGALLLAGGCAGAARGGAGGAALGGAALLALQLAATLLGAPLHAPHVWLYAELVGSAALGALLLLGGALSVARCELRGALAYVHAPLAAVNVALVVGGAVATYAAVTRRWDATRDATRDAAPARAPQRDVDV